MLESNLGSMLVLLVLVIGYQLLKKLVVCIILYSQLHLICKLGCHKVAARWVQPCDSFVGGLTGDGLSDVDCNQR